MWIIKSSQVLRYSIIATFILLFMSQAVKPPGDPDMGWHLRYGEYFFQNGQVLRDNIISYVWPDYKWVEASWGSDLILYQVFSLFGFVGLSLIAGLITLLTFRIVIGNWSKYSIWQLSLLGILFLSHTANMYGTALRPQTISTLFFALLLRITHETFHKKTTKMFYFLPFIFLLWANLHGGFSLGLISVFIIWSVQGVLIQLKKINFPRSKWLRFGLAFAGSVITPLFNPWGIRLYIETFRHTTNKNLGSIMEWAPMTNTPTEATVMVLLFIFTIALLYHRKKWTNLPYAIAFIFIFYLAFSAVRFFMIFGVMLTFLLAENAFKINWKFFNEKWFQISGKILLIGIFLIDVFITHTYFIPFDPKIIHFTWDDYCQNITCSEPITKKLLEKIPEGNGLTLYNHGGYLSWRVPQVKVFVDGRMSAWELDGKTPPIFEIEDAYLEDGPIIFRKLDITYHYTWTIIPNQTPLHAYFENLTTSHQWEKVYQDTLFTYFLKTHNK